MNHLAQQMERLDEQHEITYKKVYRKVRQKITRGEKLLAVMIFIAIIAVSIYIISNYAALYALERDIQELEQAVKEQAEVNAGLQLQVMELSSPERILYYAKEELGMTLDDSNIRVVQD